MRAGGQAERQAGEVGQVHGGPSGRRAYGGQHRHQGVVPDGQQFESWHVVDDLDEGGVKLSRPYRAQDLW